VFRQSDLKKETRVTINPGSKQQQNCYATQLN